MRFKVWASALAVALLCAPLAALAEGEAVSRVDALESRLLALEDKLHASEATIDAQRELIKNAQMGGGALGAVGDPGGFWSDVEVGGHLSFSYAYSINNPGFNRGTQGHFQFHQNHDTFSLDAVKLEIGKPAPNPNDVGFQLDLLFGQNQEILMGDGGEDSEDDVLIQEAYILYNWNQSMWKLGKFETPLGYEVLDGVENHHITHSTQFWGGIPLVHHGVLASYPLSEELSILGGVINGWDGFTNEVDFNDSKSILAGLSWAGPEATFNASAIYGDEGLRASTASGFAPPQNAPLPCATLTPADPRPGGGGGDCRGDNSAETLTINANADMQLTDTLLGWVEGTYGRQEINRSQLIFLNGGNPIPGGFAPKDPSWYAIGGGMVLDFTEALSGAGRFEYFYDDGNFRLGHGQYGNQASHYEFTTTLRYNVRPNFMIRAEYRRDWVNTSNNRFPGDSDSVFFNHGGDTTSTQDFAIVEASLLFE